MVEIVVVVALVGVLAAIGIPGIISAQRSARDANRVQSLEPVRAAMKDLNIKYPGNRNNIVVHNSSGSNVEIYISDGAGGRIGARTISLSNGMTGNSLNGTSCTTNSSGNTVSFYNDMDSAILVYCGENGATKELPY